MRNRFKLLLAAVAGLGIGGASLAHAATVGYELDVTTEYLESNPAGPTFLGGGSPSPDTSYFVVTNNGTTTFNGTIGDVAVSNFGGDQSFSQGGLTLHPGDSVSIAIGPEGSNQGGFNGPFGTVQPGVEVDITGTVTDGMSTENVMLSVHDADIHSGIPRTNPFGDTLDSYVLQGGDDLGRDTGDGYEETQAFGHFSFIERVPTTGGAAPLPSSAWGGLALLSALGLGKLRNRVRA